MTMLSALKKGGSKLNKIVYRTFLGNEFEDLSIVTRKNSYNKMSQRIPSFSEEMGYLYYDKNKQIFFNEYNAGYLYQLCPLTGANEGISNQLDSILRDKITESNAFQVIKVVHNKVGEKVDKCIAQFKESDINGMQLLANHLAPYWKKAATEGFYTKDDVHATLLDSEVYLCIDTPLTDDTSIEQVEAQLSLIRRGVEASLTSAQIGYYRCAAEGLLRLASFYTNPNSSDIYNRPIKYDDELIIKEQVTNGHFGCEIEKDGLYLDVARDAISNKEIAVSTLTLAEPPDEFALNMNADISNNIFEKHASITCNHIISVIYKSENQAKAQFVAKRKASSYAKKANSAYGFNVSGTEEKAREWKRYRDNLNLKKTKSVKMLYTVILFSDIEHQGRDVQNAKMTFAYSGIPLALCKYMHAPYFLASMPFMFSGYLEQDFSLPRMMEPVSSWNAVQMMPLIADWAGNEKGVLMPSMRNQIAQIDPFSGAFGSGLGIVVTGITRGGKSFGTQTLVMNTLNQGGDVFIIDVGGSYKKLTNLLGGVYLEYDNLAMNPFTNIKSIDREIKGLIDLFSMLTLPDTGANENDKSTLRKAILNAFALKQNNTLIDDVRDALNQLYIDNQVTYSKATILAESLEPYCSYAENGNIFNDPSKLDPNARMIVIDLEKIKKEKEVLPPVLISVFAQLQRRIYESDRDKKKMFIMDEVMNVLVDNKTAASFVVAGYRMGSRFNCCNITIAQGINDFYRLEETKVMYENTALKLIFKQENSSLSEFHKKHDLLTDYEVSILQQFPKPEDVGYSHVLIKGDRFGSFHRLFVDPFTLVAMSSKGEDFQAVENYVGSGMAYIDAIDRVAKERYRGMYV